MPDSSARKAIQKLRVFKTAEGPVNILAREYPRRGNVEVSRDRYCAWSICAT